jgi:hypothetical protein
MICDMKSSPAAIRKATKKQEDDIPSNPRDNTYILTSLANELE